MFARILRRPLWPIIFGIVLVLGMGGVASSLGKQELLAVEKFCAASSSVV